MLETLTPGDAQDLLAAWKRAWEGRDPDRALALFAEDAELRVDPFEEPLHGSLAIREWWNRFAAGSAHTEFDAERSWVAGRTVLASWHGAVTDRATATRSRHRGFLTCELDDERRIARARQWTVTRIVGTDSTFDPEPEAA
jgi:ketosteroid isomerase-like protein